MWVRTDGDKLVNLDHVEEITIEEVACGNGRAAHWQVTAHYGPQDSSALFAGKKGDALRYHGRIIRQLLGGKEIVI